MQHGRDMLVRVRVSDGHKSSSEWRNLSLLLPRPRHVLLLLLPPPQPRRLLLLRAPLRQLLLGRPRLRRLLPLLHVSRCRCRSPSGTGVQATRLFDASSCGRVYAPNTSKFWNTDKPHSGPVGRPGPRVSSLPRPGGARHGLGVNRVYKICEALAMPRALARSTAHC